MIGIRADANKIIATGHVMRCITIAREIIALGESVTFFVADTESRELISDYAADLEHMEVVVLGSSYDHMEDELSVLEKELTARNIDALLVDSYFVTTRYFEEVGRICPVAYMDDLGKEPYPVDILINYSGYYKTLGYEALYQGMKGYRGVPAKLLLGLEYAPLRRQFYENATCDVIERSDDKLHILLTAGGADMHGMLKSTLEKAAEHGLLVPKAVAGLSIDQRSDLDSVQQSDAPVFEVVVGSLVVDSAAIDALAGSYSNINIHRSVTNMAALMRSCDIAVAAAGTMLTECAAIRLPAIFYQVADNQKFNVEFWQNTGGMIFAGDVTKAEQDPDSKETVTSAICGTIHKLIDGYERLETMKSALSGLTDGCGAIKIARELITMEDIR